MFVDLTKEKSCSLFINADPFLETKKVWPDDEDVYFLLIVKTDGKMAHMQVWNTTAEVRLVHFEAKSTWKDKAWNHSRAIKKAREILAGQKYDAAILRCTLTSEILRVFKPRKTQVMKSV